MRLEDLGLIGNCQFSALVERTGRGRLVLPAALRLRAGLLDAARRRERRAASRSGPADGARRRAALPREHQRPRDDASTRRGGALPRARLRAALRRSTIASSGRRSSSASSSRSRARRASACAASRGSAGRKAVPARDAGLEPRPLRGLREPAAAHHRRPALLPRRAALRADRARATSCSPGARPSRSRCRRCAIASWPRPLRYWQRWVKHCNIPPLYQQEVIRSALALKLHCFEDTGAIVAAMTTSIPEAPGSGRTWDYRYCWLRDAYYVLGAFRLLGPLRGARAASSSTCSTSPPRRPTSSSRRSTASTARSDLEERILDELARLRRRRAGARRQRRRAARAERHLRRDGARARADLPRRALQRRAVDARRSSCSSGWRGKAIAVGGHARRRHLGVPHRVAAADLLEPDVLGGAPIAWPASPRGTRRRSSAEFRTRGGAHPRGDPRPGVERRARQLRRAPTAARTSTRRCCRWRPCASCRADDPRLRGTDRRDPAAGSRATAGSSATGSTTASGSRRSPSSSARSGWSRRWRATGPHGRGQGRDGARARRRCRRSGCSRRTTRRATSACGATSRRPTRTSA